MGKISREKKFHKKGIQTFSEDRLQGGLLYHCESLQYKPPLSDTALRH